MLQYTEQTTLILRAVYMILTRNRRYYSYYGRRNVESADIMVWCLMLGVAAAVTLACCAFNSVAISVARA